MGLDSEQESFDNFEDERFVRLGGRKHLFSYLLVRLSRG